jgi:hypothetical protein
MAPLLSAKSSGICQGKASQTNTVVGDYSADRVELVAYSRDEMLKIVIGQRVCYPTSAALSTKSSLLIRYKLRLPIAEVRNDCRRLHLRSAL